MCHIFKCKLAGTSVSFVTFVLCQTNLIRLIDSFIIYTRSTNVYDAE